MTAHAFSDLTCSRTRQQAATGIGRMLRALARHRQKSQCRSGVRPVADRRTLTPQLWIQVTARSIGLFFLGAGRLDHRNASLSISGTHQLVMRAPPLSAPRLKVSDRAVESLSKTAHDE
jgi:hypothetical protein